MKQRLKVRNRFQDFVFTRPLAFSFLLTAIFFAIIIMILRPGYGTNDDIQMIAAASGYLGGKPVPFLIFSNVLLGFVLNFLYSLNFVLNWEIWLFIVIHFCSIWGLIYLVLSHPSNTNAKAFNISIILLSSIYFVLNLTFTTVAAIASISGFCLLLTATQSSQMLKENQWLLGVILILVGSLIRPESTALVIVILIPAIAICYQFFPIKNLIPAFAVSGGLVLGCYVFNLAYLHQFPDWYFFNTYTSVRSLLQDTPRLVNATGSIRYVHWTTNDLNMFARYFFPDPRIYSLQNLRYLAEHVSDKRPTFLNRLFLFPRDLLNMPILPYTLLILWCWISMLFYNIASKKVLISSCLFFLVPLAINIYFLWTWKLADYVLLASLDSGLIFTLFIEYWSVFNIAKHTPFEDVHRGVILQPETSQLSHQPLNKNLSKLGAYANILLLLAVIGIVASQSIETTYANIKRDAVYHQVLSDIQLLHLDNTGQKALIISPAFGIPWEWANPLVLDFPNAPHYLVMQIFSPAYQSALREYQVASLPAGLYEEKNIYLMTDEATMNGIIKFIQDHERVNVKARLIYTPNYDTGTIYDEARLYQLEKLP